MSEERPEYSAALTTQVGGNHYKDMPIQPVEYIHRQGHRTSVVVIVARRGRQGGAAGTPDAPHAAQGRADRNQ